MPRLARVQIARPASWRQPVVENDNHEVYRTTMNIRGGDENYCATLYD
jgi:hypothetical protein